MGRWTPPSGRSRHCGYGLPRWSCGIPTTTTCRVLAHLAAGGIHDPDAMPFFEPWTRVESPELERGVLQHGWKRRSALTRDDWSLPLMVSEAGEPVGVQDIFATQFAVRRTVETGSWLAQPAHGRGIGTEMRAAVLHLAFAGLGAEEAYSGSFADNPASAAVSRHNGYDGERRGDPRARRAKRPGCSAGC